MKQVILHIILLTFSATLCAQSQEAYDITKQMIERCREINTLYFEMSKTERIEGELRTETFITKLQYEPFLVYSQKVEEGKSPELLFRQGKLDDDALINPDGFPWFNLTLDPKGDFMRKNQHHTLYETGYRYALSILEFLLDKFGSGVIEMATLQQDSKHHGILCYNIELNNRYFGYKDYTVRSGEDILDIAQKYMLSEYMILELNDEVDDFDDVSEGQVIRIPTDYSSRLEIAIDKERLIPISMKVYDDQGLYEQLEYSRVVVNPTFSDQEFTPDYPDYGF